MDRIPTMLQDPDAVLQVSNMPAFKVRRRDVEAMRV